MKVPKENNQEPQKDTIQNKQQEISTGGEATIIDNRPEIIVQRKIKNAILNSGGNNQIIQRAAIANDSLNMVGENHKDSGKRRQREVRYSNRVFGEGNYWKENEFTVENQNGEFERFGDPINVRILQRLNNTKLGLKEFISIVNQLLEKEKRSERYDIYDEDFKRGSELVSMLPITMINAWGLLKDYSTLKKGLSFTFLKNLSLIPSNISMKSKGEKGFLGFLKSWANEIQTFSTHFHGDFYDYTEPKTRKSAQENMLRSLKKMYGYFDAMSTSQSKFGENLNNFKDIGSLQTLFNETSEIRSFQMHEAAKKMSHKKGIWKVGEDHIQHILLDGKDTTGYNIVTKNEFDQNF